MRDIAAILLAVMALIGVYVVGLAALFAATQLGRAVGLEPGATYVLLVVGLPFLVGALGRIGGRPASTPVPEGFESRVAPRRGSYGRAA